MAEIINKKNVITDSPGVGDILFLDSKNKKHYIAFGTYDSATFPASNTIVGVVSVRQGNNVLIVHKINTTKRWSDPFAWKVTGWKIDGQAHDTTISFHSSQAKPNNPTFTYTANTIAEVVSQLNAWLEGYKADSKLNYHCYAVGESAVEVILAKESYKSWFNYVLTMSGLTVSYDVGQELGANSNTYAHNGVGSEYKGMNWKKFYAVVHDSTADVFNPSKPISSIGTYPLSYASYSNEIGKVARDIYGEGEEAYKAYLQDYMIVFPSQRGTFAPEYADGHSNTYKLVGIQYQLADGTLANKYPAAEYCAAVSYPSEGLEQGSWYLPSMYELAKIYKDVTKDLSGYPLDPVNVSLSAISGSPLWLNSVWSSCRGYVNFSWIFNGNYGCSSSNFFYSSYYAVPVVLLKIEN